MSNKHPTRRYNVQKERIVTLLDFSFPIEYLRSFSRIRVADKCSYSKWVITTAYRFLCMILCGVCVDFCKWRSLRLNWREEKLLEARCAVRWSTDSKLLPRPPPPNPRFALEWFTPSDSLLLSRLITKAMIKRGPTIYHDLEFRDRSLEFGEKLLWISFEYQNLAEVKLHCVYHCPN